MPFTVRPRDYSEHGVSMVRFGERRPLLEVELNEVQQNFNKKTAEIIKQSAYSGFLKMNNLDGHTSKTKAENINRFYLTDFPDKIDVVNLDGQIISLRNSAGHGNIEIRLPEPPTSGVEENLVFLEFWYADIANNAPIYRYSNVDNDVAALFTFDPRIGVETTRRTQLRYRIRVQKSVDFNLHEKGVTDARVRAWGNSDRSELSEYLFTPTEHDPMLFRAGTGDERTISYFNSVDGYVYALPMFKVHRRNSGGFTAKNPNGAFFFRHMSDRPDGLFADVIDKNDIVDLRNNISLTGFNYQKLLAQEFDKFLRAENRKGMLSKTYHGIPKTPTTSDTIFYASLDGTTVAEIGGQTNLPSSTTFTPTPTGLGAMLGEAVSTPITLTNFNKNEGEISFLIDFDVVNRYEKVAYLSLLDATNAPVIQIFSSGRHLTAEIVGSEALTHQSFEVGFHYITLAWKKGDGGTLGETRLYIDGQLKDNRGYTVEGTPATKMVLGYYNVQGYYDYNEPIVISDIHISKKCALTFGAMPTDFREGSAKITPKFSQQRRVYGDGQVSQVTVGRVRRNGTNHSAGIQKQQANNANWSVGDTITIKGLGGEIISGIVDASELKVRISESTDSIAVTSPVVKVSSTENLTVNKRIRIWNMNLNTISPVYTIASVNTAENTVTLSTAVTVEMGSYIINETFVTSVPIVKAGTSTVTGTWVGLGTQQAVFTITAIPSGDNTRDISINYSLNTPARQKGLVDNLDTIYEAEINGELLFPRNSFAITDDLKNKSVGNTTTNPNVMKYLTATSLGNLGSFTESSQSAYNGASTLNGELTTTEASGANQIPQRLFTFDLIKMIELKFGKEIPDINKLDWIKSNIESVRFNWHGYGTSPTGAKASVGVYNLIQNTWNTYSSHTYGYVYPLMLHLPSLDLDSMLDSQGNVNFIVFAEKAGSAEHTATLFTDYASIEIVLRGRDNHVFLVPVKEEVRKIHLETFVVPENNNGPDPNAYRFKPFISKEISRRDVPFPNLVFIQKNTKRIELVFDADNNTSVVTYGSHTPVFSPLDSIEEVTVLAEDKTILLTDVSTENSENYANHHWKDPLYRVRNDGRTLNQNIGFKEIPFTADSLNVNVGALITVNGQGPLNYFTRQYAVMEQSLQAVAIAKYLVLHKGEIKLLVFSLHPEGKLIDLDRSEVALLIRITGNPIIKEVDGIKRTEQIPTTWRTSTGNLRGYIDEYGTFIATYQ